MLTIFSTPKPFKGHIEVIQRNAITSWTLLCPTPEIILFGEEEGTQDVANGLGLRYIPGVIRNEFGTPLVSSIFELAQDVATNDVTCYVNADIILMHDFMTAVQRVAAWRERFLMVGQRWDVNIAKPLNFDQPGWEPQLCMLVLREGRQRGPEWIDYFAFRRGLYRDVPPFAIGRLAWDNWLLWKALSAKSAVVDASRSVVAVHQNHLYHHPGGFQGICESEEAVRNRRLAGDGLHGRSMKDAPYDLSPRGIRLSLPRRLRSSLKQSWLFTLNVSRPVRHALGINHETVRGVLDRLRPPRRKESP